MQIVYLDVCCLNRPFDDQAQERVRQEAAAVLAVQRSAEAGTLTLVASDVISAEIGRTRDPERRASVEQALSAASDTVAVTPVEFHRASELVRLGFAPADALHVACAEAASADVLLTTDNRLLRAAARSSARLKVQVANPVDWLRKVGTQ